MCILSTIVSIRIRTWPVVAGKIYLMLINDLNNSYVIIVNIYVYYIFCKTIKLWLVSSCPIGRVILRL